MSFYRKSYPVTLHHDIRVLPYLHKFGNFGNKGLHSGLQKFQSDALLTELTWYKARHAHKRLYTVLPKYSKIQVLPGITSCRLVKDNKQAIELNSLLLNNMPKNGYG